MSGVSSNGTIGPDPGIASNYDYLQHTTIQHSPQQHPGYYHQHNPNHPPPQESYRPTNQQYYQQQQHVQINQQHYYQQQDTSGSQQNESWQSNVHSQQYHQQTYYPQDPQHYQQNHSYHQQHPPIHQLNSFVNHQTINSPSPQPGNSSAGYPTSSSASSGYVSQASPPPQRSLSPIRPGPGSSPGAVTNHMMPVRLQNMAKGARTKAGMRKLMQMQEQQGQNASPLPPIKTPPSTTKKSKAKKSPSMVKMDSEDSSCINSNTGSVEEAIEAVLVSTLTGRAARESPGGPHSQSGRKTPPASALASRAEKVKPVKAKTNKVPESPNTSKKITKSAGTSSNTDPLQLQPHSSGSIHGKRGSISQETLAYLSQSQDNPTTSDLLFEKLGLNLDNLREMSDSYKTKASPAKRRRTSSDQTRDSKSLEEELSMTSRTRRNYSGSTDTYEYTPKKTPSNKSKSVSVTPKSSHSKRKAVETPKSSAGRNTRTSKETPKVKASVKKENDVDESPLRAYKKRGRPPSATGSRKGSSSGKNQIERKSSNDSIPADGFGASIQAVAHAIVTPNAPAKITKLESAPPQSKTANLIPRIKRKYTKRAKPSQLVTNPLGSVATADAMDSEVSDAVTKTSLPNVTPTQTNNVSSTPKKSKAKIPKSPLTPATSSKGKKAKKVPTKGKTVKGNSTPLASPKEIQETTPGRSKPIGVDNLSGVLGSPSWIENVMERRSVDRKKLKIPTVSGKSSTLSHPPSTDVKKEPGPSLKVNRGVVKFYRGNVEEDVDESMKKLDAVLKDNVSKDCDADTPWLCTFCGLGPHDMRLGDLFGPYLVGSSEHNLRGKIRQVTKKEVWVHTDCALWAGDVILVGSTLRNLDEAVSEAEKVVCKICQNVGATIGCLKRGCTETAHYPCAQLNNWSLNGETFHSHCRAHLGEATQKPHLRSTTFL